MKLRALKRIRRKIERKIWREFYNRNAEPSRLLLLVYVAELQTVDAQIEAHKNAAGPGEVEL